MNRKGMSQVLALIVAASVLMMAGLTLVLLTQGSLNQIFGDSDRRNCISSIQSTCRISSDSSETHATPASCSRYVDKNDDVSSVSELDNAAGADINPNTYTCN